MSTPFLGYITAVGFNFAPVGFAFCQGQLLPISQYDALYALLGTTYGGDGQNTFALPDLRGRTPIGIGQSGNTRDYQQGQVQGVENVTIAVDQMPQHTHAVLATANPANSATPGGIFGAGSPSLPYSASGDLSSLAAQSVLMDGQNLPHSNLQPYLAINWIIALEGIFPSRN